MTRLGDQEAVGRWRAQRLRHFYHAPITTANKKEAFPMAMKNTPFGKDRVVKSSESFIEKALTGGSGPSAGIHEMAIDRPGQKINTAVPMDNVKLAMPIRTSILDTDGIGGGVDNLKHSLTGTSAVNEEVGATGKLTHVIIPNH